MKRAVRVACYACYAVAAAAYAVAAATFIVGLTLAAFAHDAPSGWSYPANCCGGGPNGDCAPVQCGAIDMASVAQNRAQVLHSGDGQCHLCLRKENGRPRCVFFPDRISWR